MLLQFFFLAKFHRYHLPIVNNIGAKYSPLVPVSRAMFALFVYHFFLFSIFFRLLLLCSGCVISSNLVLMFHLFDSLAGIRIALSRVICTFLELERSIFSIYRQFQMRLFFSRSLEQTFDLQVVCTMAFFEKILKRTDKKYCDVSIFSIYVGRIIVFTHVSF